MKLAPPSRDDKRADQERFLDALGAIPSVAKKPHLDLQLLKELPDMLRSRNFNLRPVVAFCGDIPEIIVLDAVACYGLALDIGTTNMVASLHDMRDGRQVAVGEAGNPQRRFGADVLTRIFAAMEGRRTELHRCLIDGINNLVHLLCADAGIHPHDVFCMTMAGNTIMTHFFLDLPVQHLPRAPYIPVAHSPEPVRAAELGLALNPHARVVVFPNAGSYVGGDIVAGILAAGMHRQAEPCMLIDVGTNVEIVLGCREWLMVGAGAAGPALEGDIAAIGMSAREGAIAGVSIRHGTIPDDYEVLMTTIGDTAPRGICGSGMIELIAELFRNGLIDGQGKLKPIPGRTVSSGNGAGFVIAEAASGQLVITELEIANFIRSKAALFAALQVMTGAVGLRFSDLSTVQVAGAFGQWINVDKAVSIGMLPDIDRKKFRVLGNSSLAGATQYLGDRESKGEIRRIAEMITYRELNEDGDFMRHLTAGLFLPHTNPDALKG